MAFHPHEGSITTYINRIFLGETISILLVRVAGMRTTVRVDGPDVLEVERWLELPRGRRRMLSARAAGRSRMLPVVVAGRGRHLLLTARRRVEDLALLS